MIKPNNTKNCYFKMKKPEFQAKTFIQTVLTIFQSQVYPKLVDFHCVVFMWSIFPCFWSYGPYHNVMVDEKNVFDRNTWHLFLLGRKNVNSNFQLKRLLNRYFLKSNEISVFELIFGEFWNCFLIERGFWFICYLFLVLIVIFALFSANFTSKCGV